MCKDHGKGAKPPPLAPRRLLPREVLLLTHPTLPQRLLGFDVIVNPRTEVCCVARIDRGWASRLCETCIIPERRFTGPFLSAGLIKVGFEQDRIPTVRLEADIHNVANDRHQADEEVERNIAQHSEFDARWKADLTGRADHHQRGALCVDVS